MVAVCFQAVVNVSGTLHSSVCFNTFMDLFVCVTQEGSQKLNNSLFTVLCIFLFECFGMHLHEDELQTYCKKFAF